MGFTPGFGVSYPWVHSTPVQVNPAPILPRDVVLIEVMCVENAMIGYKLKSHDI